MIGGFNGFQFLHIQDIWWGSRFRRPPYQTPRIRCSQDYFRHSPGSSLFRAFNRFRQVKLAFPLVTLLRAFNRFFCRSTPDYRFRAAGLNLNRDAQFLCISLSTTDLTVTDVWEDTSNKILSNSALKRALGPNATPLSRRTESNLKLFD